MTHPPKQIHNTKPINGQLAITVETSVTVITKPGALFTKILPLEHSVNENNRICSTTVCW